MFACTCPVYDKACMKHGISVATLCLYAHNIHFMVTC